MAVAGSLKVALAAPRLRGLRWVKAVVVRVLSASRDRLEVGGEDTERSAVPEPTLDVGSIRQD